ncbi:MAG: hypothetical protein IJH43_01045 [Mogibacterium sp.]|nr:hypothetical protein [Mogibacterium sp.]
MDNDRRDARTWAQEWSIRQRNLRIIKVLAIIAIIIALYFVIHFITVTATRTTFHSVEEMRAAMQGRYETDYCEDIEIIGDDVTLTYYEISHYDPDYAEKYGYSEYDDSVYEDSVEKWDYRNGVIKCRWMDDLIIDKQGNIRYYNQTFVKTDADKPVPFDRSILDQDSSTEEPEDYLTEDELNALDASKDSLDQTEEAAEDAGVVAADANGA